MHPTQGRDNSNSPTVEWQDFGFLQRAPGSSFDCLAWILAELVSFGYIDKYFATWLKWAILCSFDVFLKAN